MKSREFWSRPFFFGSLSTPVVGGACVAGKMESDLLEIQPRELKFVLDLKRRSSCSVHLINNSSQCVAYKVKTTSPTKYRVRPTEGIVLPKATCNFTVTLRAQEVSSPDWPCNDKFLVQSRVVSFGTTEEDLNRSLFSKENGQFIQENKLRVVIVSPPHFQVLQTISRVLKQEPASGFSVFEETPLLKGSSGLREALVSKQSPISTETQKQKDQVTHIPRDQVPSGIENFHPSHVLLRRKYNAGGREGFPFLFVCFVALVSLMLGYSIHS